MAKASSRAGRFRSRSPRSSASPSSTSSRGRSPSVRKRRSRNAAPRRARRHRRRGTAQPATPPPDRSAAPATGPRRSRRPRAASPRSRSPPQPQPRPPPAAAIAVRVPRHSWIEVRDATGSVVLSAWAAAARRRRSAARRRSTSCSAMPRRSRVTLRGASRSTSRRYVEQNVASLQGVTPWRSDIAGRARHERRAARRGARCGSASRTPRATCSRNTATATCACPIVEPTALFVRGIGECTDVVEKEMYTFEDKLNGESLTLRPEATAGIVRAAIEHNLIYERPQRVWTAGPMFRHERPQKGRYRQFHQFDVEALGFAGPRRRRRADGDARAAVARARPRRRHRGCRSIRSAIADERRAHRAALDRVFRAPRATCSTPTRSAGCTPIRCASSTARIRRCRR